jgi:hypothetical protein
MTRHLRVEMKHVTSIWRQFVILDTTKTLSGLLVLINLLTLDLAYLQHGWWQIVELWAKLEPLKKNFNARRRIIAVLYHTRFCEL